MSAFGRAGNAPDQLRCLFWDSKRGSTVHTRPIDRNWPTAALVREWPGYRKRMPRAGLAKRIDVDAVMQTAAAEPDLARLLTALGLINACTEMREAMSVDDCV